jgi:large subunit ribosomal protein L6
MSRLAKKPIPVPKSVSITIGTDSITLKNSSETVVTNFDNKLLKVSFSNDVININQIDENYQPGSMFAGTLSANLKNTINGLSQGFTKILKIEGVGYKAQIKSGKLALGLGFSHPLELAIPKGVKLEIPSPTEIRISGVDKRVVGQFAAVIRSYKQPEPYNGKGIAYSNEKILRKVGKTAKGNKK